jgi:hypothetical protein
MLAQVRMAQSIIREIYFLVEDRETLGAWGISLISGEVDNILLVEREILGARAGQLRSTCAATGALTAEIVTSVAAMISTVAPIIWKLREFNILISSIGWDLVCLPIYDYSIRFHRSGACLQAWIERVFWRRYFSFFSYCWSRYGGRSPPTRPTECF